MKKILICSNSDFFKKRIKKKNFFFIEDKKDLKLEYLKKINPSIIFFPHWNFIINETILSKFTCIGFHSSPLPYGRGGSPIQNMIVRGFISTEICAFKIISKLDAGPVYSRNKVSLRGNGNEIFLKIYKLILKIVLKLSKKLPTPKKQLGKVTFFKRRKANQGNILNSKNIKEAFNIIRMLDVDFIKYPKAYAEGNKIKLTFTNAKLKNGKLKANVEISEK